MKPMLKTVRRCDTGFALMITLCFVTAALLLFAGVMLWSSTNSKLTQRNETFTKSEAAAEAATEKIFTSMNRDFLYSYLNTSNTYNVLIPDTSTWPVGYKFSDTSGNTGQVFVSIGQTNWENLNEQYAGLNGIANDCTIIAVATPTNQLYNVPATVKQTFQAAVIPVFQFAIFYNMNMEIDPTPTMVINGSVFCNQSMWITDINGLTFNSLVEAVGTVTLNTAADPFANGYSYGGSVAATFKQAGQPNYPVPPLTMPIGNSTDSNPTNIEAILNLPPSALSAPNAVAYDPTNQIYYYNSSDIVISNASYGTNGIAFRSGLVTSVNILATNFTVWFQDKYYSPYLIPLTNDYIVLRLTTGSFTNTVTHTGGLNATNYAATNILYAGFSFLTNVLFYDWREGYNGGSGIGGKGKPVQAVQIDVAKFQNWLTINSDGTGSNGIVADSQIRHDLGHGIGSIYVYNSVPLNNTQLPAVRLVNGSQLPTNYPGLTVSTPMPAYILGNYNVSNSIGNDLGKSTTTHTRPASVLADAITILSPSWSDTYTTNLPPVNIDDTVNAAVLEGIVPSNPNIVYSASGGGYSGGVENVLRYLEDWSGNTNTYNGSIVVMFPSVYATNSFHGGGTYYSPPNRNWSFDNNFTNQAGLPPDFPSAKSLIRNNWSAY